MLYVICWLVDNNKKQKVHYRHFSLCEATGAVNFSDQHKHFIIIHKLQTSRLQCLPFLKVYLQKRTFHLKTNIEQNFFFLFNFQAFDITSKVTESLDHLLADSLEEHMPLNGLQVFGISQIADNTEASTWFHIYIVYKKSSLWLISFMVVDYLTPSGVVFFKDRKH